MITVLERQRVMKRSASPVHLRARSEGVRWNNADYADPSPRPDLRPSLGKQAPRVHRLQRPREVGTHRFLQGQLIRVKRGPKLRVKEDAPPSPRPLTRERESAAPRAAMPRRVARVAAVLAGRRGLLIMLCILAAVAAMVAVGLIGAPLGVVHPAMPAPVDTDPALYALLVPEPAPPRDDLSPVLLTSLKVATYRTQPGDSLSRIAARFKLNIDTLVSWNGIRYARSIAVGTELTIPNADGLKYTVRRGDTLQGIARSSGVDLNSLLDWNRLPSSVISAGQDLFLPGARMNTNELNRVLGSLFMYPVMGRISSFFGQRPDPFTGVQRFHNGVDIVNRALSPILAAMAGTVGDTGFSADYGYYVILKHTGSYQTLYGHLTRYLVTRGQKVQQGQRIGELGSTGYSTGPHLHFSIFHNGEAVDPLRFIK
jgi:murein DD-endopeptidase MepM/ murein hydrolase activator NlpD